MRWSLKRPQSRRSEGSIADEVQQFLDGGYLEAAFANGQDLPAWAWLSVIAHGDEDLLRRTENWVAEHRGVRPEFDTWGRLLQHLARQTLMAVDAVGRPLRDIQRELLIPLELAVIASPVGPVTLYRLVGSMFAALGETNRIDR